MSTCSGFIEPLNLQCVLVNMFAGNTEIFLFIALLIVSAIAARFKMRNGTGLLMLVVFAMFFSQMVGGLYFIIITLGDIIAFLSIKKIMSR